MLTKDERAEVEDELVSALASRSEPRLLIQAIFTAKADHEAILVRTGSPDPLVLAAYTLDECLRSRWTRNPSLIESLLEYLVTRKGIGRFDPILMRVRQRIDPNPSVYDSSWLLSDILEETLQPTANICKADLLPCLKTRDELRRKTGRKGIASKKLAALADDILKEAPAAGKERLETLNAQLIQLLRMP